MDKLKTLAVAAVVGLAAFGGVAVGNIDATERRFYRGSGSGRAPWGTKAQQRKGAGREKRKAKNKMARKSRAKGR